MITIAERVELEIKKHPLLADALIEGVANINEIARRIKPVIEEQALEPVSTSSIAMALRRAKFWLNKSTVVQPRQVAGGVGMRANIVEFLLANPARIVELQEKLFAVTSTQKDCFVNVLSGQYETMVLVSDEIAEDIASLLTTEQRVRRINCLSIVTVRYPEEDLHLPGVFYPLVRALAWEKISYVESYSIGTEINFVFEEKSAADAFEVIRKLC